jgi:hypothetical protein
MRRSTGARRSTPTLYGMNWRYFACPECRKFTSAGYRWAYWSLEHPGIVEPDHAVNTAAVNAKEEYWQPPRDRDSEWLYERIFPTVRLFFEDHEAHGIVYLESGTFFGREDFESWQQVGEED